MEYRTQIKQIKEAVGTVITGKDEVIEKILMATLAGGHVLMEDIPGVGKTTMALAFSKVMMLENGRVQFTPDVLPSDIVGFSVLNGQNEWEYKPGAVMCNIFLADEINRTSPKTQSALLEVMEEGTVTVDGNCFQVPKPFVVIATQNPITSVGTQLLPESQLDRFMIKLTMGYPSVEQEIQMLKERGNCNPLEQLEPVITREQLLEMQQQTADVFVQDSVYAYVANLVDATRNHGRIHLGVSPRGSLALVSMAKACAFMQGRDYVVPEDVSSVFCDVAAHRILLNQKAKVEHLEEKTLLEEILATTEKPKLRQDKTASGGTRLV